MLLSLGELDSLRWKVEKVAQHLAKGGLDAEAVASVFLHLQGSCVCFLHEAAINLGVACVSAGGHVPRHPLYALPLRRGISQLRYASVYGLRHPAQLVGVGLAFLAKAPVREPLVEGLRFKHLGSSLFVAFGEGVACCSLLLRLGAPGSRRTCVEVG